MNIDTHYMIREKIDETPNFQVFSGEMKTTCEPVAITVFKAGKATESDKIRFMKEYEKIGRIPILSGHMSCAQVVENESLFNIFQRPAL